MYISSIRLHRSTLWTFMALAALAPLALPAGATDLPAACDVAIPLLPTDADRDPGGSPSGTRCYRLDLPAAGLLHLDLSVAGSESRARLALVAEDAMTLKPLARSTHEWLARSGGGVLFLTVAAEDPRRPLPPYRLSSRFAALEKSDTDGELEPDPDPVTGGCLGDSWRKSDTDGELEPDPDPLIIPGPVTAQRTLCSTTGGDDHGDSLHCATPILDRAAGTLANGWGDDVDVFRFRLCAWRTVEVATAGDTDTHGGLYDRSGQRLAGDDDGGDGGNFRLVRTLGPGVYFVRVEGERSTGPYALEVRTIDR